VGFLLPRVLLVCVAKRRARTVACFIGANLRGTLRRLIAWHTRCAIYGADDSLPTVNL
jgi:hypothetical protein